MATAANGAVLSLVEGGTVATTQYTAEKLASLVDADRNSGALVPVRTGEGPDDIVYVNPKHVTAVQPAVIVDHPTEDTPA